MEGGEGDEITWPFLASAFLFTISVSSCCLSDVASCFKRKEKKEEGR